MRSLLASPGSGPGPTLAYAPLKAQLVLPHSHSLPPQYRERVTALRSPGDVDVVRVEAAPDEPDAGVALDLVHRLGDSQPVVPAQAGVQRVGNLHIKFSRRTVLA